MPSSSVHRLQCLANVCRLNQCSLNRRLNEKRHFDMIQSSGNNSNEGGGSMFIVTSSIVVKYRNK